jgi:hypothetical protein
VGEGPDWVGEMVLIPEYSPKQKKALTMIPRGVRRLSSALFAMGTEG